MNNEHTKQLSKIAQDLWEATHELEGIIVDLDLDIDEQDETKQHPIVYAYNAAQQCGLTLDILEESEAN